MKYKIYFTDTHWKRVGQEHYFGTGNIVFETALEKETIYELGAKRNLFIVDEDLQERINKAIEYIEHAQNYGTMAQVMPHLKPYINGDDLLDILKGSDSNE